MTPKATIGIFLDAAKNMINVALACAIMSMVNSMLSLTGLGLKLSSLVIMLSGENLASSCCWWLFQDYPGHGPSQRGRLRDPCGSDRARPGIASAFPAQRAVLRVLLRLYFRHHAAGSAGGLRRAPVSRAATPTKQGWLAVKAGPCGIPVAGDVVLNPSILMTGSPAAILQTAVTSTIAITVLTMWR